MPAQLKDIPVLLPENSQPRLRPNQGIAFARDELDKCRFAAAVWAQDCNMFSGGNAEIEAVQRQAFAALDEDVLKF